MDPRRNRRRLGGLGERWAAAFLVSAGYRIRDRNYRDSRAEFDLVAEDPDGTLVFVEVKSDLSGKAGDPLAWVGPVKMRRLARLAQRFAARNHCLDRAMRFDVIAVDLQGVGDPALPEADGNPWEGKTQAHRIRHVQNAFLPPADFYF